jgi:hypothetical protein
LSEQSLIYNSGSDHDVPCFGGEDQWRGGTDNPFHLRPAAGRVDALGGTSQAEPAISRAYERPLGVDLRRTFENIQFDAAEFDARAGTPGLHTVQPNIRAPARQTILPPDLFRRFENLSFWREPHLNPRNVKIV